MAGLELADSITIDPHKWFYAPLDAGAVLVKDETRLTASFGMKPAYLTDEMEGAEERYQYYVHGFEQSRRFRSLKVWMSFKRYGDERRLASGSTTMCGRRGICIRWSRMIRSLRRRAIRRCRRFAFGMWAGVPNESMRSRLHAEVAERVEKSGKFWIGTTELKGRMWFRINPVNFRTRQEHMEQLLELLRVECREVVRA